MRDWSEVQPWAHKCYLEWRPDQDCCCYGFGVDAKESLQATLLLLLVYRVTRYAVGVAGVPHPWGNQWVT